MQNPGGQRGAENDQKQAAASVFFFEHRPGEQQEHDIAAVVLPARMAEHMGKKSQVGERVTPAAPIKGEVSVHQRPAGGL